VVNGLGTVTTFVVLLDVVATKFSHGAWMVLVALPILVALLYRTNRAYSRELTELKVELSETLAPPKPRREVLLLVEGLDRAALAAVRYARQPRAQRTVAVHVAVDPEAARRLEALWAKLEIPLPLEVVRPNGLGLGATVARVVAGRARPDTEVTVLLPRRAYAGLLDRVRRGRRTDALLQALGGIPNVHVTAVPRVEPRDQRQSLRPATGDGRATGQAVGVLEELVAEAEAALAPPKPRHEVVVLIEGLDRASLGALQYATELHPLAITALHVAVDPDRARRLAHLWAKVRIPIPLDVVDCPDRNLLASTERDIHERTSDDTELTVLVPRRRFARRWHQLLLHDRTSAGLVRVLGDLNNVNVAIVPFQLGHSPHPRPPVQPETTAPQTGA
jgi:hypothetical protein